MRFNLFLIICLFIISSSCDKSNSENTINNNTSKSYEDLLKEKEAVQYNQFSDNLGDPILTIEFNLKAEGEELKTFEDGIIPWISLENPSLEIKNLINPDEIVLPYNMVIVMIDYPLNHPVGLGLSTKEKGFSRRELIEKISKLYNEIYKEEEKTAKTKTIPVAKREKLINRNQTDGKYGIWGHDLSDLDLSSIEVYKTVDNKIMLSLSIES